LHDRDRCTNDEQEIGRGRPNWDDGMLERRCGAEGLAVAEKGNTVYTAKVRVRKEACGYFSSTFVKRDECLSFLGQWTGE
jgi:hypothetical protein